MSLAGVNILLAEDNPTNQMVATQMLESLGARVTLAVDGVEALEILDRESFDIGLIDIEMPRLSGIELIRKVRAGGGDRAGMPLVALTAYVMREHTIAIEDAGADGIIAKPILSIEGFGKEVLDHIRRRKSASGIDAAAGDDPDAEVLDKATFDALLDALGADAKPEFVRRLTGDLKSAREQIVTAHGNRDMEGLGAVTHILISVCGSVGAMKVHRLARCLNSAGHLSDVAAIDRDVPLILHEIDRLEERMRGETMEE